MKKVTIVILMLSLLICSKAGFAQNDPTYFGVAVCQTCHSGAFSDPRLNVFEFWKATAHATAYDSISAFVQQTAACLQCHTTGWDTSSTGMNAGADDFVTIGQQASFNVTINDSTEFFKKQNVQCESCHGPASQHAMNVAIDPSLVLRDASAAETCGECHQDEHHPFIEEWSESAHAASDTHPVAFLQDRFRNDPNCSGCHTIQGFIQFVGTTAADTINTIPNVTPPGDDSKPLVCAACHDPHDNKNPSQLRIKAAQLCIKCHNPEDAAPGEDVHHATSSMFAGEGAVEFPGFDYRKISVHQILEPVRSERCVTCHVFTTPFDSGDPDDSSDDVPANTGHTFEPRVEGCMQTGCHAQGLIGTNEGAPFNHRGRQVRTDSLVGELQAILENASSGDSTRQSFSEALFNLQFVTSSGSRGVHNPFYAEDILVNTIAYVKNGFPTSVADPRPSRNVPEIFALHQNYPNPFNPTTIIRFDVARAGHIKLIVFNALGQQIKTLVDEELTPKSYEIIFNADNLSSGIYLYKLITDKFTATRKMLILK